MFPGVEMTDLEYAFFSKYYKAISGDQETYRRCDIFVILNSENVVEFVLVCEERYARSLYFPFSCTFRPGARRQSNALSICSRADTTASFFLEVCRYSNVHHETQDWCKRYELLLSY